VAHVVQWFAREVGVRRSLVSILLFLLCLTAVNSPASAGDQWCEDDPVVVIITPGGSIVPLFVTNGALGVNHLVAVQLARISYTVEPTGGSTLVRMKVVIPDDLFGSTATRTTVSTGPLKTGAIFATANGVNGQAMHMQFTLAAK
jgi:hypothetical protein